MSKLTCSTKRAGVPSAGPKKNFLGWRSPVNSSRGEWQHKNPLIDLRHSRDISSSAKFHPIYVKGKKVVVKLGYKFYSIYGGLIAVAPF